MCQALWLMLKYNNEPEKQISCSHKGVQQAFSRQGQTKVTKEIRNDPRVRQTRVWTSYLFWWERCGVPWEHIARVPLGLRQQALGAA